MTTFPLATMLAEIAPEELSATLDRVAMEILTEVHVEQPPVDAFGVAKALGITIATDERQPVRARYVRLRSYRGGEPRATILLRPEPRTERRQWAVAHELGEHAAFRVFELLAVDPRETSPLARESIANHLAGRLLLPEPWFSRDAPHCGWDLLRLKTTYRTASHELIARRMLEFSPTVIITIIDRGRITWRRSNLPGQVPPPATSEMNCWRSVHRRNRPRQNDDGSIRGWPVHEPDWKREILRREVDELDLDSG
jgi:hypothetical protein